jgi:hypothetical protein
MRLATRSKEEVDKIKQLIDNIIVSSAYMNDSNLITWLKSCPIDDNSQIKEIYKYLKIISKICPKYTNELRNLVETRILENVENVFMLLEKESTIKILTDTIDVVEKDSKGKSLFSKSFVPLITQKLTDSIGNLFVTKPINNLEDLAAVDSYFELKLNNILKLFAPVYITKTHFLQIHNHFLNMFLVKITEFSSASSLLKSINWLRPKIKQNLDQNFVLTFDLLNKEYSGIMYDRILVLVNNAVKSEIIEYDENGEEYTTSPIDVFNIINLQLEANPDSREMVFDIVDDFIEIMEKRSFDGDLIAMNNLEHIYMLRDEMISRIK